MTTKEKLYLEILNTDNAIADLDESYCRRDLEKCLANFIPSKYKTHELKDTLESRQKTLARLSLAKRVADYLLTPVGKEYKAGIDKMLETVENNIRREISAMREVMGHIISREIGDLWKLQRLDDTHIEIALCDNEGAVIFGHSFTIYYGFGVFYEDKFRCEINLHADTFDPMKCPTRLKYIQAVGTFATLCSRDAFRNLLREYAEKREAQKIEHAHLRGMLENPPALQ